MSIFMWTEACKVIVYAMATTTVHDRAVLASSDPIREVASSAASLLLAPLPEALEADTEPPERIVSIVMLEGSAAITDELLASRALRGGE